MGPKVMGRDLVLPESSLDKKPTWVCKKGTFGSPVVETGSQSGLFVNIQHIYNVEWLGGKYIHIYMSVPGIMYICT